MIDEIEIMILMHVQTANPNCEPFFKYIKKKSQEHRSEMNFGILVMGPELMQI